MPIFASYSFRLCCLGHTGSQLSNLFGGLFFVVLNYPFLPILTSFAFKSVLPDLTIAPITFVFIA